MLTDAESEGASAAFRSTVPPSLPLAGTREHAVTSTTTANGVTRAARRAPSCGLDSVDSGSWSASGSVGSESGERDCAGPRAARPRNHLKSLIAPLVVP